LPLRDKNSNYKFDQKNDKIAFVKEFISVPQDSMVYALKLFKEKPNFKAFKPKQEAGSKLLFPYEGNYKDIRIQVLGDSLLNYKSRIIKSPDTDTLYYWYKPDFAVDTTFFVVTNGVEIDTFKHRFRTLERDSLTFTAVSSGTLNFDEHFTLSASTPLMNIDASKITMIDKDSIEINFQIAYDSILNRAEMRFEKAEGQKYSITMMPETFVDFFEESNKDTLMYSFRTKMKSDYGNIRVNLVNAKFPLIVQLVNDRGEVKYEEYTTESPTVDFTNIVPQRYDLRAVFDTNANGKYDSGDFLLGIQPERVSYSKPIDEVRANFDQIIEFILLD
jgi:hypothetical protein